MQIYLVKKSDFDKELSKTWKSKASQFQYYAERVDIIREYEPPVEEAEETKSEK